MKETKDLLKEKIKKLTSEIKEKIKSNNEIKDISIDVDMNIDDLKKAVGDFNNLLEKNPELCEDFKKISELANEMNKK